MKWESRLWLTSPSAHEPGHREQLPGVLRLFLDDAAGDPLSRAQIREGLHGNLCRCTGYGPIVDAVQAAQEQRS